MPLTLLDLAPIPSDGTATDAVAMSVELARAAERSGYDRVWYAEHHGTTTASAAPAVLAAHVASRTKTIRVGAGGVMLPNHSPLSIAEQFGTLAAMYPNRIDLGVGRATGADAGMAYALRRDGASDTFEQDVAELRAFLGEDSLIPGVVAVPGQGTRVPITILGSSLFGARLAAKMGLPFAFAAHFSPGDLDQAVATYRRQFKPSAEHSEPYLMITANVIASDDAASVSSNLRGMLRFEARKVLTRRPGDQSLTDAQVDTFLDSPQGAAAAQMFRHAATGNPSEVVRALETLAQRTGADELILVHQSPDPEHRIRSLVLTGRAMT
ncbi:alkane 1-monooxygenase [Nocardioides sp. Root79]|nr:alkane 1-monooxygenase [Nocardioides sp. Root79]KRC75838.1 alkane 1-monooxygenase [Nocardioides sp. Root240]